MAYSGDLITINGVNMAGKVKEYTVQYTKLWKDAERNMAGDISANLIGIFPKLSLTIRDGLTEDEISALINALLAAYFSVTYFDPASKAQKTAQYYAADFNVSMLSKHRGLYKSFSVSLVPVSKRS